MERDYGQEIIHVFSQRLKLVFALPEASLPAQMALSLERLKRREVERSADADEQPRQLCAEGAERERS